MPDSAIVTAADYADALITARRAKNVLALLLIVILLGQLSLFFTAKYSNVLDSVIAPTTLPVIELSTTQPVASQRSADLFHYALGLTIFLGITVSVVFSLVVFLIVKIMLVGRLIGVAKVTSAYIFTLVLIALLFPWQAFLQNAAMTSREFIVPGVLYTWDELVLRVKFANSDILGWARFVAWPVVTLLLVVIANSKSNKGLAQALGEADAAAIDSLGN